MRADLAPLLLGLLALCVGVGILHALGFVDRSARAILAAAGLAYLVGYAAVGLVAIALLAAGLPVTLPMVVVVAIALLLSVWLWRRRRPAETAPSGTGTLSASRAIRPRSLLDRIAVVAFALFYGAFAIGGLVAASATAVEHWDGWSIWTRKAVVLSGWDRLPTTVFTHTTSGMPHPDYPLLLPLYEALGFRAAGTVDTQSVDVRLWILFIAFGGAMAFLGARLTRPLIWVPVVLCTMIAPGIYGQLLTGYADVPMGVFLGVGTVLIGVWVARGGTADLALGTLMLAAAASTKNEGLTAALSVLGAAMVVTLARRSLPSLRRLAPALAAFAALILPWRLWLAVHHIKGDLPLGKGLEASYLDARAWRVDPAISALTRHLGDETALQFLVPVALVLCAASLVHRRVRPLAGFYLISGVASFALLVWAYWISPHRLSWHLATSANRVVIGIAMLAVAAILQLSGALESAERTAEGGRSR